MKKRYSAFEMSLYLFNKCGFGQKINYLANCVMYVCLLC